MVKRIPHKGKGEPYVKGIVWVIVAVATIYIIYNNLQAILFFIQDTLYFITRHDILEIFATIFAIILIIVTIQRYISEIIPLIFDDDRNRSSKIAFLVILIVVLFLLGLYIYHP